MSLIDTSREPLREIVASQDGLDACLESLASGTGPVAFDAERAHGHRYWPKAYLVQLRREGAGTWLIDPIAFEDDGRADLSALIVACGQATWIIHAASQDLPCMIDIGIVPGKIFDSELAARLLGKPGASLSALLDAELGIRLRKAHSADNWSKRPLPMSWLVYAALDVDYLPELAQRLAEDLVLTGRHEWAEQEFAEVLARCTAPAKPKTEPWRRLRGITTLRSPAQLAVARELWLERDAIAQRRDRPPMWILPDDALVRVSTLARDAIPDESNLRAIAAFDKPPGQRYLPNWLAALERVRAMDAARYPRLRVTSSGIPHPRGWSRINPDAAARWEAVKPAVDELACDLGGLQPSLIAPPAVLQQALFEHRLPDREVLLSLGARPWQVDFLGPLIADVLGD